MPKPDKSGPAKKGKAAKECSDFKPNFDISPHRPLYPFKSNYVKINGFCYHYLDEGKGDPIVMVHGNPTWSFYYRELIKALSPNYRCVVPDHIGCGLSEKPSEDRFDYSITSHINNLEKFLDTMGLKKNVTLVVHDWGGPIGLSVAARKPERISRLILLNTGGFPIPKGKKLPWQLAFVHDVPILPKIMIRGFNAFAHHATRMCTVTPMSPEVAAGIKAPYNSWADRVATYRFVKEIPVRTDEPNYPVLKQLDSRLKAFKHTPTLVCWGEKDFVFDMEILEGFKKRLPHAEYHTFPKGGHFVLEDEPKAIIKLTKRFLAEHPLRTEAGG